MFNNLLHPAIYACNLQNMRGVRLQSQHCGEVFRLLPAYRDFIAIIHYKLVGTVGPRYYFLDIVQIYNEAFVAAEEGPLVDFFFQFIKGKIGYEVFSLGLCNDVSLVGEKV